MPLRKAVVMFPGTAISTDSRLSSTLVGFGETASSKAGFSRRGGAIWRHKGLFSVRSDRKNGERLLKTNRLALGFRSDLTGTARGDHSWNAGQVGLDAHVPPPTEKVGDVVAAAEAQLHDEPTAGA